MATIKDVSAYTGLALGTVSKYLNGQYVRPENKILLDNAVSALDYRVNQAARNLKQTHKKRIGVLVPTEATSQYSEMLCLFEEELFQQGYSCMMIHYPRDGVLLCQKINMLRGIIDGMILISSCVSAEALHDTCGDLPIILIDHGVPCESCDNISVDYRQVALKIVTHLLDSRHTRFGLITEKGIPPSEYTLDAGYRNAMSNHMHAIDSMQISECEDSFQDGFHAFQKLMQQNNPPTAILVTSSQLTMGVIASAQANSIALGKDITLIGSAASNVFQLDLHNILLVKQPLTMMAKAACELVISRLCSNITGCPTIQCLEATLSSELIA